MTKEEKKELARKYYQKNREKLLAKQNKYYRNNKDIHKKYYSRNKERIIEYQNEYQKEYDKKPMSRANSLLSAYKRADKINNRGEVDFDARWIVENIFSKPCAHCGETDWHKLGCNRLDNSKPHTKDNVEPCCGKCNIELSHTELIRNKFGRFEKRDASASIP